MARRAAVFLGDLAAESDMKFSEHFVESVELQRINNDESHVIFGSKGVGKTALRRALAELQGDSYFVTATFSLDDISFAQTWAWLSFLRETSRLGESHLAMNIWRNVLAMFCLETVAGKLAKEDRLRNSVREFLIAERFITDKSNSPLNPAHSVPGGVSTDSNGRFLGFIDRLLERVIVLGRTEDELHAPESIIPPPSVENARQIRLLTNEFPSHPELEQFLIEAGRRVRASGKAVLVCLDGFDSIVDDTTTPEARTALLTGLIDAIFRLSRHELFTDVFCFKAFLPQEMMEPTRKNLWDADKFSRRVRWVRWGEADFQELLRKRLLPFRSNRSRSLQFDDIWLDFMPDRVKNSVHGFEEPTFNYILRHTLYRPRQILEHVQNIFDTWDDTRSDSARIDPSHIPKAVANKNLELSGHVVNQLAQAYPTKRLHYFFQSWGGAPGVCAVGEFYERMSRILELEVVEEVPKFFDVFIQSGIVGIANKSNVGPVGQRAKFHFHFVRDDYLARPLANSDDLVAFSPMFREYTRCDAAPYGAIIPSAW